MKTVICYASRHHGNTRRVVEAMAREGEAELIDATAASGDIQLEDCGCIGFASGIYFGKFHPSVLDWARRHLPQGKPVFFVCTYGSSQGSGTQALRELAAERGCPVLGTFGCRGYDTFGPFKLVGGIAKGRPNEADLAAARAFYRDLIRGQGESIWSLPFSRTPTACCGRRCWIA